MGEGSLDAPIRHPLAWREDDFYDFAKIEAEARRVFDICHGCRRCFNLCDSFPRLFDLIDGTPGETLDEVTTADLQKVVDACTLCDMCFMTKCPYVPPHEFNLDFPHLMLRWRAADAKRGKVPFAHRQMTETDRNGRLGCAVSGLANWACKCGNNLTRPVMESVLGVHRDAKLPEFASRPLDRAVEIPTPDKDAPAYGRKVAVFATCFANFNNPGIGKATLDVLAKNGVQCELVYPGCCGMPQLEQGDIARVAAAAKRTATAFKPWIEKGYDVVALVPSCALMMKFEWPLIEPHDEDVTRLARATRDVAQYVIEIAKKEGLAPGMTPVGGAVATHIACHARAQNMGQKAAEMLRLIPEAKVSVIERCSGHGGSWGVLKENFPVALKVGRPVAKQAAQAKAAYVVSECPLARDHIVQGIERQGEETAAIGTAIHPIEVMARAYGL